MSRTSAFVRQPFFLDSPRGARFAVATQPVGAPIGALLFVPPFAEEMNKSRRTVALAAQTFAELGWVTLQIDLGGSGDSEGDFGEADWDGWQSDLSDGWNWLRERCDGVAILWTLRAGSLLAADWLARNDEQPPLLLWQPVSNGSQHLTQFLRLKAASEMLAATEAKGLTARLRAELGADRIVEVAGYRIAPAIAAGLAAATLRLRDGYRSPVALVEVVGGERTEHSPGIAALAEGLRAARTRVVTEVVQGPSFWQTLEIETPPTLIETSVRTIDQLRR